MRIALVLAAAGLAACAPSAGIPAPAPATAAAGEEACPRRPVRDRGTVALSAEALRGAMANVPGADTAAFAFAMLADRGSYLVVEVTRTAPGAPERHRCFDDVMVVLEGAGTLRDGGTLTGARPNPALGPGEEIGGTLARYSVHPLRPGSVMVVPARTPHQVWVEPGGSIRYLIVKAPPPAR